MGRRAGPFAAVLAVLALLAGGIGSTANAAPTTHAAGVRAAGSVRNALTYDWQSLGHDDSHDAFVNDPNMNYAVAPTLGINWMTNLLSADLGGPTLAFNPTLNATVVYAADQRGNLSAFNESNGQTLWTTSLGAGAAVSGTPLVSSDETSVWVGTTVNPTLYKLDAATGAVDCSVAQTLPFQASPTEGIDANGAALVYISTVGSASAAGPLLAFKEADCTQIFSSNPYSTPNSGAQSSPSFGTDKNGRALVFVGTTHPDGTEYAIDATTGALDWQYAITPQGSIDITASATISPPGANGFADGVVYVIGTNQIAYALDLTTGKLIWQFNFGSDAGTPSGTARSTAALDGNTLVLGMANGVYALNATTGAKLWHFLDTAKAEVMSSPAIVGPPGKEVVAFGDLSGTFYVVRLLAGGALYHYQTGSFITGSAAYTGGHFTIASTDGFLYDFALGGGNGSAPSTALTSPSQGASLPYSPTVTIAGTATDAVGANSVEVAVQSGGPSGPWYNAATQTWSNGAVTNTISVASPGSKSSAWSFGVPAPLGGTTLQVYANAVNTGQIADVHGAKVSFSVAASKAKPKLTASAVFIAPAASFGAKGSGFHKSEQVTFALGSVTLGTATSNSKGLVNASLKVPTGTAFGATPLTATGAVSKLTATTAIYVANAWLQAANGSTHSGFESNDPVFAALMSPGGNTFLAKAWYYAAGAAVESAPAVYNGSVIFGNDAGTLTAIGTDTAATLWTYKISSGAAIRSTPAIDPTTGNLVFSADDGSVYVVNASTGKPVATASVGGLLTAPALANTRIFIASDSGAVESLDEQTGALLWKAPARGAVHTTPAVDASKRVAVVGDDAGFVTAFLTNPNGKTGLQLWQAQTGAKITATPVIANGLVYAGSNDQHLYTYNEATGVKGWTFSAGVPLTVGAAYDPTSNLLYEGLPNGRLDAVNAANGTLAWSTVVPNPYQISAYVGVSAAPSLVVGNNSGGALTAFNSANSGQFNYDYLTGAALTTAPTLNDGTVYVGASDGGVYAFTPYGRLPLFVPPAFRQAAAQGAPQAIRVVSAALQTPSSQRFSWIGQRDVPLHVDAVGPHPAAGALRYHGGAVQTSPRDYVVLWKPAAVNLEAAYGPAILASLKGSLGGAYVDTTPYPAQMSDAAIQAEVAKAVAVNHWPQTINAPVIVFTANGASASNAGFCSYHSAFAAAHDRSKLVAYALVPYSGAAGACAMTTVPAPSGDPALDAMMVNLTRVRVELRNDPLLNGWYDARGGEIGAIR